MTNLNSVDPYKNDQSKRCYDLDWLRVLAVLLLIPFHTALIFGSGQTDHWIKAHPTQVADLFAHFTHQWHMPLLFLVSGMAAWLALGVRTPSQYRQERMKRLLSPLLLLLLFYPLQAYYWFLANQNYQGSFLEFYPIPFVAIANFGIASVWGHLWFLVYLFVFSLLCMPLFTYFRSQADRPLLDKIAALATKPGAIFLGAIPLSLLEMALRASWGNTRNLYGDWANFCFYLTIFIYGYLLASDPRFRQAIARHGWLALGLGVVTFGLGLTWLLGGNPNEYASHANFSPGWFLYIGLRGFNSWFWLIALLSLGQKFLNFTNKTLSYLNQASMPVYILHMPLNVVIGYYVLQWGLDPLSAFLLIALGTLAACYLLYELLIKHSNAMRFLFGLKSKKKPALQPHLQY